MIHLYGRLIPIRNHQDLNRYEEQRQLDYVRSSNYPVPARIEEYFRSLGDTEDDAGTDYKVAFPVWLNHEGHFGQVNHMTHQL